MTNREFYTAISNIETIPEDLREFATNALTKMDENGVKRRTVAAEKAAEKQAERAPIRDALLEVMGDAENPKTASMLIEEAGLTDTVKPTSVPSLMRPLVETGVVVKVDMKIPGKGTARGYVKA